MSTESTTSHPYPAPDGVLIGHLTPGTEAWEEARTGLTITATEIAAVMGLSPWQSPFSLWHKKAGLPTAPFEMNPAIEWGTRLEDAVAAKWEEEHPGMLAAPAGTWRNRERDWQRATPDRLVYEAPRNVFEVPDKAVALLEVKTSPFGDEWGPAGSDEIPIHYRCQILWQLDTLGLDVCHIALLVSGHDYREYVVTYDADEALLLRKTAAAFLRTVEAGERPPIDGADATYQTIRVQPDGREDRDVEISTDLVQRYDATGRQLEEAKEARRQAAGEVLDLIGNGYRAVCGERRIAYRTVKPDGTTRALMPYQNKGAA
jgi:putative phage-type endonuclease